MKQECLPSDKFTNLGYETIPIIEVSSEIMTAVQTMVASSQSHCIINNTVVIQNGLTTNQVRYVRHVPGARMLVVSMRQRVRRRRKRRIL